MSMVDGSRLSTPPDWTAGIADAHVGVSMKKCGSTPASRNMESIVLSAGTSIPTPLVLRRRTMSIFMA